MSTLETVLDRIDDTTELMIQERGYIRKCIDCGIEKKEIYWYVNYRDNTHPLCPDCFVEVLQERT